MQMLDVSWEKFKAKIVVKYFEKAEISKEKQSKDLLDAYDPFKDLQEQLESLPYITPSSFQKEPPLMISSLWINLSHQH